MNADTIQAACEKCGAGLGGVTYGVPVSSNSSVRYEGGHAYVSWRDGSPHLYGHTCTACQRRRENAKHDRLRARGLGWLVEKAARRSQDMSMTENKVYDEA